VTYTGPGGVHVTAPKGWTADHSNGPNVVNYVRPGDSLDSGTYFHIGIGDNASLPSIRAEARDAMGFLRRYFSKVRTHVTYLDFQGTTAVDIEYVGTSPAHVHRHGIECLWIKDGVTRIIELTTTAATWSRWQPLFVQLVNSARVS
jgi:hypothetical protein